MSAFHDVMFKAATFLPPEFAHKLALQALRLGLGPREDLPPANHTLFGKPVASLVGLAGGADKNGVALKSWKDMGFGHVEVGTVTALPRSGNEGTRIWRMPDEVSLVNFMGLPNQGMKAVFERLARFRDTPAGANYCLGVSIASPDNKLEELSVLATQFARVADYLSFNGSCPNLSGHCAIRNSQLQQVATVKECAGDIPVLVKLAPTKDPGSLQGAVEAFQLAGADGFIACNTASPAARDVVAHWGAPLSAWPQRDGKAIGGWSGPALLPTSKSMVATIRAAVGPDVPVIGVGGINSANRAQQMVSAGATAVQIYTGFVRKGPKLLRDINAALNSQ